MEDEDEFKHISKAPSRCSTREDDIIYGPIASSHVEPARGPDAAKIDDHDDNYIEHSVFQGSLLLGSLAFWDAKVEASAATLLI